MTEEDIIELIKSQENAGMEALADKYGKLLSYIISGILGKRPDDIEECVNDTYLKIWRIANHLLKSDCAEHGDKPTARCAPP